MSSNQRRREDKGHHRSHYHHGAASERTHRSEVNSESRRSKSPEAHHSHSHRQPNSPDRHRSHSSGHGSHHHHHHHHQHHHSSHPHSMATSGSHRTSHERDRQPHDVRVLRCFCNCSQLTAEQIESVAMMNVSDMVNNPLGNRLFKAFLKIGHRHDKSNAMISLECYELCTKITENIERYNEHMDDLIELCPSYLWEEKLNDAIYESESDAMERLQSVLHELKLECLQTIETHNDFDRFRRELLRKIGK